MKNTIGKVLLMGLMGGIALGAVVYHMMQTYLSETDAQDPVKADFDPESAAADDAVKTEDVPESAAADDVAKAEDKTDSAAANEAE